MGITTSELKQLNCDMVYRMIYENNGITKQMIAKELRFSLPTISQNLEYLLEQDKIHCSSHRAATGGRPAQLYKFNYNSRITISVELLANMLNVAAVNLAGEIIAESSLDLVFTNDPLYFETFSSWVNHFIASLSCRPEQILGITIAIQGVVDADQEHISFGTLLSSSTFVRTDFAQHFQYPVSLIHDAEAAGIAESWHSAPDMNAIYLSLNANLGCAVIVNGQIMRSRHLSSGVMEHLTLYPNGIPCYCGKCGCAESYCSANTLIRKSGLSLPLFFQKVRDKNIKYLPIWQRYLQDLALMIDDVRMVIGGDVIIGGLLTPYLTDEDLDSIKDSVYSLTTFKNADFTISKGKYGKKATLIGTALTRITDYLKEERLVD